MNTQLHRTASSVLAASAVAAGALLVPAPALAAPATPVPVGTPPVAAIELPAKVWAGIPVTLSGGGSTSSGAGVSEWEWNLDGKGGYEHDSLSTSWVSKSFGRGSHTVTLRVRNEAGLVDTATKTFTAKKPPAATVEPGAPPTVTAVADGTAVDVTWATPVGAPVLAYQVSNTADQDADPIYVPATAEHEARFDGLVPGDYRIRVAAINAAGTGPGTEANAKVLAKGGPSSSASASPTATDVVPTDGASPSSSTSTSSADPTTAASTASKDDNKDTIGIVLIAAGGVVLVGAGITAAVAAWRRRRAA